MKLHARSLLLFIGAGIGLVSAAAAQPASDPIENRQIASRAGETVMRYHDALADGDVAAFAATLDHSVIMFNCSDAGGVENWDPHLFLAGDDVAEWASFYVAEAGPHEGAATIVSTKAQGNIALIVTNGTGRNKFREWTNEKTVWLVRTDMGEPKVGGFCVVDIQLPG